MRYGPFVALLLVAGVGFAAWRWIETPKTTQQQGASPQGGRGQRGGGPPRGGASVVPVSVAPVRVADIPIYREGIGNVQARQTVTVRSQVDGPLTSVEFVEGQTVRQGDVLARIDPSVYQAQYDQAIAKKAQDEATLANARLDLQRYQRLAQSEAGPKQQADQQAALVAQLTAQVQADQAAIASARTYLGYTTITSPLDGRAGLRQVDPGNVIRASDAAGLVTITQIQPINAVFTLPQRDLEAVRAALARGATPVEIAPNNGGPALATGTLEAIDNQIDATTGTVRLKASFPNADQKLWPGQFVSLRVAVETLRGARVAPATAVRRGPNGPFVYVVTSDDEAVVRPVELVLQDETQAVFSMGVEAGERVVTVGFARLTPGARVMIAPDPSAPDQPAQASAAPDGAPAGEGSQRRRGQRPGDGAANAGEGQRGEAQGRGQGGGRRGREGGGGAPAGAPATAPPQ